MPVTPQPPIVPVLEAHGAVGLAAEGGEHNVKCPFHNDRRASATYNPDKGLFCCHACEIAGDAIAVVMKVEGVEFAEAVERIQAIAGGSYSQVSSGTNRAVRSKLPLWARQRISAGEGYRKSGDRVLSARRGRRQRTGA